MSLKSFIKIGGVSAGNITNAMIGFVYLAVVAKILNLEDFGKYALLTSLLLLFSKIIDFGSNSIFVTKSLTEEDSHKIINGFHTLKLLLFVVSSFAAVITLTVLGFNNDYLIVVFLTGLFGYAINITCYAHLQKEEKFGILILLNTIPSLIKGLFATLALLKIIDIDLNTAFYIFSLSILSDILLIPLLPKSARSFKIDLFYVKEAFIKGIPSGVSQLVQESWSAINNTIAKVLYSFTDVGIFSMANKISSIFSLVPLSIFTVLLPKNAKRKKINQSFDIKESLLLSAIIIFLAFMALLFAQLFLHKVFGSKFEGSIKVLDTLIIAAALSAINSFTENYFLVGGKTTYILLINLFKVSSFLVAAIVLTPVLRVEGLAYANLVAGLIAISTTLFLVKRSSKI